MFAFSKQFQEFYSSKIKTPNKVNKKIAVVWSSPTLLGSNLGEHIDKFDVVVRINFSPTSGFEADVGSKTTHRILDPLTRFQEGSEQCLSYDNLSLLSLKAHIQDSQLAQQEAFQSFYSNFQIMSHHIVILFYDLFAQISNENTASYSPELWGIFFALASSEEKPVLFGFTSRKEVVFYFNHIDTVLSHPKLLPQSKQKILKSFQQDKSNKKNVNMMYDLKTEALLVLHLEHLGLLEIHSNTENKNTHSL